MDLQLRPRSSLTDTMCMCVSATRELNVDRETKMERHREREKWRKRWEKEREALQAGC